MVNEQATPTITIGTPVTVRGMKCVVDTITRGGVRVSTIPTKQRAKCTFLAQFKEIRVRP